MTLMKLSKNILFVLSVLSLVMFFSCQKETPDTIPLPHEYPLPQGQWLWTATVGSLEMASTTPDEAGFRIEVVIYSDYLEVFKNGNGVVWTPYTIVDANGSACKDAETVKLLRISAEASETISMATGAAVTIPAECTLEYENTTDGKTQMTLHETTCAGFTYIFRKI